LQLTSPPAPHKSRLYCLKGNVAETSLNERGYEFVQMHMRQN
jgi:hypothetical protein